MTIKRIAVEDLKPGMFVHDLDCGYLQHGFLLTRFLIRNEAQIRRMRRQGLDHIYIDTDRGGDLAAAPALGPARPELAPILNGEARPDLPGLPVRVSQQEEAVTARRILGEAQAVVEGLLHDVRMGRRLDPARAEPLVEEITGSVLRNPGALLSLGRIKQVDRYTFQHSVSVCALLVAFAQGLGMAAEAVHQAGLGGLLHDTGKMRIPPEILSKPGRLTAAEFAVMKTHATLSRQLLEGLPGISAAVIQVTGEHHERVDGQGYPGGLAGEAISIPGRMAAIADCYDAITSNRCYHRGIEPSEALKKLLEWSGSQLDGELVQHFIRILGIYPVGSLVRLESGLLAVVVEQGEELLRPTVRIVFDAAARRPLTPRDLVLCTEAIECFEDPAEWGISTQDYL